MSSKTLSKPRFIKHPYMKKKLRVLDEFSPGSALRCPACLSRSISQITVVDSEYRGGVRYQILQCDECNDPQWVVLLG